MFFINRTVPEEAMVKLLCRILFQWLWSRPGSLTQVSVLASCSHPGRMSAPELLKHKVLQNYLYGSHRKKRHTSFENQYFLQIKSSTKPRQ